MELPEKGTLKGPHVAHLCRHVAHLRTRDLKPEILDEAAGGIDAVTSTNEQVVKLIQVIQSMMDKKRSPFCRRCPSGMMTKMKSEQW
ncbi:hypothetical protein ACFX13_002218 [Malus domestica]